MRVYLDNGATTKLDERVLEAMKPYFIEEYGNPASLHTFGQNANEAVEAARRGIAKAINAMPEEIIFTSGGTESNALAIMGTARKLKTNGNHVITSKIEHPSVLEACRALEREGFKVTYLDVDSHGLVHPKTLERAITSKTILVTIMYANNEIGTIQPVAELGRVCLSRRVRFHTDAVQALGKLKIDVKAECIDMLSASAHKLHGPKGVGLLYVKKGLPLEPILHGGGHEKGLRSGTSNVPGIVGFAKALELAGGVAEMQRLRDRIIKELLQIPDTILNGHPEQRLPNNINVSFKYIEGEAIVLRLDAAGIAVSTGSACSSLRLEPSHVLSAIGLPPEHSHGSIRITLSRYTTEGEVDYFLKHIKRVVEDLRKLSPFGR